MIVLFDSIRIRNKNRLIRHPPLSRTVLTMTMIRICILCALLIQLVHAFLPRSHSLRSGATSLFLKRGGKKKKKVKDGTVAVNRQARRNFDIVDTMEAGISLLGTEVKSVREGKMNIGDGFCRCTDMRSLTLFNVHIGKHDNTAEWGNHEELRPRPLLVHKEEARKWQQQTDQTGMTIVPLKAYFNAQNKLKIKIGLAKGKNVRDKRQDIKERDNKREESRIIKNFRV